MILVDEILNDYGQRIVSELKENIMSKDVTAFGPVNASGKLRDSVRYEVSNGTLRVYALGYSYFLEYGRKPGKRPPKEAIKQWIADKGIVPNGISTDSLAYLIARKIGEKGSMIYQQGGSDLLSSVINDELIDDLKNDFFKAMVADAVGAFRSQVLKLAA